MAQQSEQHDIAEELIERLQKQGPAPGGEFNESMAVSPIDIPDDFDIDVKSIRKRLGLSQTEFSRAYGFSVHTLRKWEQGVRRPEKSTRLFLLMIRDMPEIVQRYLNWLSSSARPDGS
ncbi:helix-turn-helix domain-containing protein [Persicimonas caeni]|uniref:Helix-turn-helix domain-containing protein n=1 Tax=Persicimonas caeni TaxID=2292766 RepID=A0A4Y6PVC0_PERCE|nr:helix-turn-helix domain-containing protein [Persicimonas caeni]QDG52291.1 helix-turn-helix domain-containing protein [Persicimonas caeni]QED33513.1 helix-turn-helix domain-containing protein [Persicimonas caeni]